MVVVPSPLQMRGWVLPLFLFSLFYVIKNADSAKLGKNIPPN